MEIYLNECFRTCVYPDACVVKSVLNPTAIPYENTIPRCRLKLRCEAAVGLVIVGALRAKSFNRQLANKIVSLIGARSAVSFLDYADIPFMNQDMELPLPQAVARVRSEVQAADGLWICTPQYNAAVPGVLKNLLDWLSRLLVTNDFANGTAVTGKR